MILATIIMSLVLIVPLHAAAMLQAEESFPNGTTVSLRTENTRQLSSFYMYVSSTLCTKLKHRDLVNLLVRHDLTDIHVIEARFQLDACPLTAL
jgi:hypothetical protein